MTTPGLYGGDGLVRPLNAPQGQQVLPGVQPGVTGGIVLATYVIIFGANGGMFVYSGSPGPGNPPVFSVSNATSDPYGNAIAPGIWAGPFGGTQAGLEYNGSAGQLLFPVGGTSPTLVGGISGVAAGAGGSEVQVFSAQDSGAGNTDRVFMVFADHLAGVTSAEYFIVYMDANGVNQVQAEGGATGLFLFSVASISAVLPGTGTSTTNPAQPETWHAISLDAGWTAGSPAPQYRLTPAGDVQFTGNASHANFTVGTSVNATTPLPAAYRPANPHYWRSNDQFRAGLQLLSSGVITAFPQAAGNTQVDFDGIVAKL